MGLLSFIYSVLGYNLCATLFIAYLLFDYVLGALATFGARYVMESKSGGAYDFYIRWIRVDYGWTELTLTIGPITFKNPKKFKMTPFLIKIDRISCRVNPRSFLDWIKKKKPMEARTCVNKSFLGDDAAALAPLNAIEQASRRWRGDLISTQVENVEIERMRLHMERDGKGEMNCWAALGMDAAAGEAAYADAQKSSDKQEQDLDPEAFEDDGKNEFKGMDKKEKKKAKKSKREKEEAKHAGGVLGMFAVKRVCLRGHRYDIDAFMRKTKTTAKDVQSNIIKMQMLEVFDGRGKKDKKGNYPGLYLDDIIKLVVVRCVKTVMSTNGFTNIKMGLGAAGNQIGAGIAGGANAVNNTAARGLLNMGQTTGKQVNARLKGKEAVADSLVIVCHSAKHLPAGHKKRPAAYLKLQVGKKGVKQKTPAAPASNNPDWGKTITLTPITDLEEDLRIQVYDRRMFAEDDQLGQTLKIPLRDLIDNASVEKWYDIEPTADKPLKEGEKSAQIKLSIELHGVKAIED